jgi:hypothetical protein
VKPYNCPTCLLRKRDNDICPYCKDENMYIRDEDKMDELLMYEQQGGVL